MAYQHATEWFERPGSDTELSDYEQARRRLIALTGDFSIEVTPKTLAKLPEIGDFLPAASRVYIACLPGQDWEEVVAAAGIIRASGLTPVPHIPARAFSSPAELERYLQALTERAAVDDVLVIGGGDDRPAGGFSGSLALLESGALQRHGIRRIGLAGHPEGQRALPLPGRATSHEEKWRFAAVDGADCRFVTQFLFEAKPLLAWEAGLRQGGSGLPIHVGIPGPATLKTLLTYGRMCGVGNSMRVLTRQGSNLLRLASLSCPDRLLMALAGHVASEAETRIQRLHLFPFGGIARTARWMNAIQAGRFELSDDLSGFTVEAD
jgi:methylenetetrahydrofolate reductase (NADPH)